MSGALQIDGKKNGTREIDWRLGGALILAAGLIYSLHLLRGLSASEAYSALAAGQPGYGLVIRTALRFDPGKPPLYQILLHSLVVVFGGGEAVLRVPSVLFSMAGVGLLLVLGSEVFGPPVGVTAAIMWALNPLAIIYGGMARMYAMLIALSLGQFLILWRLRRRSATGPIIACGVLGAAILYTHLGSALFLGAEAAMLAGAAWRGDRNRAGWTALFLSLILFAPFVPIALSQVRELIVGHWVDWIGSAHQAPLPRRVAAVLTAGVIAAALTFAPRVEADDREPLRWCAAIGLIPIVALAAGAIAVRPMFHIRYVSPSVAVTVLLLAGSLSHLSARAFRLSVAAIATALVCLFPYYPRDDPWRDFARLVADGSPNELVFFESGFVDSEASGADAEQGFPDGFFRVPFDRYFRGPNPRRVVDPSQPAVARRAIAGAAASSGGAWLISGFGDGRARDELPRDCFKIEKKADSFYARVYHIVPVANCSRSR